jgi:hypothetical protein
VVPEVNITTPAELSSRYRSEEITISFGGSFGTLDNVAPISMYGIEMLLLFRLCVTDLARLTAGDEHRMATCCALVTKYVTSSGGFATALQG